MCFFFVLGEEAVNKNINKHRETQLQLQKKIQQKYEGKERKRKIQVIIHFFLLCFALMANHFFAFSLV